MTAARQRNMAPQSDTDIRVIIQEAQHRWLRPQEVCEILRNYKRHNFRLNNIPPQTPQSGSLFLFDRKTLRYFRKDGHNWRKKKDGKTVREAHERLKAGSIDVLHCYYAHGEDNHNFQRRAYWMLDPAYEHIVLVHYREVSETNRLCRMPESVDRPSPPNPALHSQQHTTFGHGSLPSMGVPASMPSPETMETAGTSHSPELEDVESADPEELDEAVADFVDDQSVPQLSLSEQLTDPRHLPPLSRQTSVDPWDHGFGRANSGNVDEPADPTRFLSQEDFKQPFPNAQQQVPPLSSFSTFHGSGGHMNSLNRIAADLLESPGPSFNPREGVGLSNPMHTSGWGLPSHSQGSGGLIGGVGKNYVKPEPNSSSWRDMLAEVTTPTTMRNLLHEAGVQSQQQTPSRLGREPSSSMGLPVSPKGRGISDALSPRNLGREPQSALEADLREVSERIVLKEAEEKHQVQRNRWQSSNSGSGLLDAANPQFQQPKTEPQTGNFMPFVDMDTLNALVRSGQGQQDSIMYSNEKPWSLHPDQQAQDVQNSNPYLVHNQAQPNFQSQDQKLQVFPPQQQQHNILLEGAGIFSPTIESLLKDVSRDSEANIGLEPFKSHGSTGKIDSFGKNDSFGRWIINNAADISDITQGPGSSAGQLWYSGYSEDTMAGVTQQMDEGLTPTPSLSEQLFNIIDFSPEWGFSSEDTKVIISVSFVNMPNGSEHKWHCMFGTVEVPAELVSDGSLRCKAPQQDAGTVPFYITCGDRQACSQVREFEYRSPGLKSYDETVSQSPATTGEVDTAEELLLKIKLSRMLLGLVNGRTGHRTEIFDEKDDDEWKELENMVHMSVKPLAEVKEQLLQTILRHKLQEWLKVKSEAGDGRGPSVLDDRGQGVPHYMAALGYDWSIQPLYDGGIPPNFRDDSGWTALHWAAKYGRENSVVALLEAGVAAPNLISYVSHRCPRGETASDLASAGGHGGIAGFLAEKSLTERLSSMTLHDDLNEIDKMTANLEGDKVVAQLYRRTSLVRSVREADDEVKLKASIDAVRLSTQTGALLQSAYRLQSFRRRAQLEPDEYGLSEVERGNFLAARKIQHAYRGHHRKNMMRQHLAATRIQQKFRGWKGRREYQTMRQRIIKVQAHVRGRLVRSKYRKILFAVGIVEKVVLRWLRKRKGLKGFQPARRVQDGADDDEDLTKEGRQLAKEKVKGEVDKVIEMARQKEDREQYVRLRYEEQRTSASKSEIQEQLDYYASRDFME